MESETAPTPCGLMTLRNGVYPGFPTLFWGLSGFFVDDLMGKALWKLVENAQRFPRCGGRVLCVHGAGSFHRAHPYGDKIAASSDCSRPVNDYVHIEAADLCRPNARFTQERQGYQVLTPFGKLGYSRETDIIPREKGAEMSSVLRPVRKRKKGRTLGPVEIIRREDYADLELDAKVELIRSLVPLGLMHVEEVLDAEVTALAGERYARKAAAIGGRRHGSNPGTVGLAGQRVPIRVPRIRHVAGNEMRLRSYEALQGDRAVNDRLLKRVLYGISCRNYEAAAEAIPGAIGLSGSTVSRGFIQASAAQLREFQERDLSGEDVVAVVLDGKTFADATMVIALGITLSGEKRFLGFVETDTENAQVLTPFLRSLVERGLDVSQGVLVILDGGKGLRSAVRKAFRDRALVHRCQWHKRENVVRYLAKREQASWRQRLQRAYNRPTYPEALGALETLHRELEDRNQSAAGSLAEGLDETLTLHRLGLYGVLGRSLKTTNCLESINALVEERCAKVDHWQHSSQRHRWLATALLDIEPRLRKVMGYRHLPTLRIALKRELKINTTTSKRKAA